MAEQLINIDVSSEVQHELAARVVAGTDGKPQLEPLPGTAGRWRTLLARHQGKGALHVTISRVHGRRSLAQNRLLWHVYGQVLDRLREKYMEAGGRCPFKDRKALHKAFKHRFLGYDTEDVCGTEMELESTTTLLTIEQFSGYVSAIVAQAATWGIYVEMPEA